WQAAGLGLLFPGAGFISVGGWALLLIPTTLALFALAAFAWFGSGMVMAPVIVWLGSAALAGALAGQAPVPYAPFIALGAVIALGTWVSWRGAEKRRSAVGVRQTREAAIPAAVASALASASPRP